MNFKRFERNRKQRIALATASAHRSLAREKTRRKPEDIAKNRFLFGVGTVISSFFRRLFGRFFNRSRHFKPIIHARGLFGRHDLATRAPRWFRALQSRHLGELPFGPRKDRRKARRYALRGYGYIAPEPKRGEVEVVGNTSKATWRKPKAKV